MKKFHLFVLVGMLLLLPVGFLSRSSNLLVYAGDRIQDLKSILASGTQDLQAGPFGSCMQIMLGDSYAPKPT